MTTKETYNGWSNYTTWRVNLEMVKPEFYVSLCSEENFKYESVFNFSEALKFDIEDSLTLGADDDSKAYQYAMAFMSDVNWYEIAHHVAESYPYIIKNNK